ncbi:MAG: PQQ-binding-like beta-propeller repeat protein, partial [Bacteroidales bacterium]|nr:PQQ-binding-like beta-propeller repeat protein [Bacteroidales bacterium]
MELELDESKITQNFGNQLSSQKQLLAGDVLAGRYQIQDVIGIGGMGSVYRARDLHFPNANKVVAVKEMVIPSAEISVINGIVKNFEREANILVTLSHPSIPKIFDYFTIKERSYLVLEYIHGKDLEAVLNSVKGFFPEDQLIIWAIELCDVLSFLHNHRPEPIIFRDVKPSNIMINQQGHVVLIDFGIAKNFKTGQKGTMIGTEGYSPPEQYRGEATHLADIYALGATLHHLLTRRDPRIEPPFTFNERPIRSINPAVSDGFEAVVMRSLQYDPQKRYQTADEMREALLSVAGKTGALNRAAYKKVPSSQGGKAVLLWKFQCEDEIRGSPAASKDVVYIGAYDNNLYALRSENGEMLWKCPSEGGVVGKPLVLEDAIYFGSEDGNIYAVFQRNGKPQWKFPTGGPIRSSPVQAEDFLYVGSDDGFLHAIHLINKKDVWHFDAGSPIRSGPCLDNNSIAIGTEAGDVFLVDFHGEMRWR